MSAPTNPDDYVPATDDLGEYVHGRIDIHELHRRTSARHDPRNVSASAGTHHGMDTTVYEPPAVVCDCPRHRPPLAEDQTVPVYVPADVDPTRLALAIAELVEALRGTR